MKVLAFQSNVARLLLSFLKKTKPRTDIGTDFKNRNLKLFVCVISRGTESIGTELK